MAASRPWSRARRGPALRERRRRPKVPCARGPERHPKQGRGDGASRRFVMRTPLADVPPSGTLDQSRFGGARVLGAGLRRDLLVAVLAAVLLPAAVAPQTGPPLTPDDGATLAPKLADITAPAPTDGSRPDPVVLYEREVNGYLRFQAASSLPVGVTDPSLFRLAMTDTSRQHASVDLSALSSSQPRGALDSSPLSQRRPARGRERGAHDEPGSGSARDRRCHGRRNTGSHLRPPRTGPALLPE